MATAPRLEMNFVTGGIVTFPKEGTTQMTPSAKLEAAAPSGAWFQPSALPLDRDDALEAFDCLVGSCESVYASGIYDRTQFSRCSCSALASTCEWFPDSSLCAFVGTSASRHTCSLDNSGKTDAEWTIARGLAHDPSFSGASQCLGSLATKGSTTFPAG